LGFKNKIIAINFITIIVTCVLTLAAFLFFSDYSLDVTYFSPFLKMFIVCFILIIAELIASYFIISYYANQNITKPLAELSEYARAIKEKNFEESNIYYNDNDFKELSVLLSETQKMLQIELINARRTEEGSMQMISDISHDLKTPITTIKGYVEGLLDGVATTKEMQGKYLNTILAKAKDLETLTDNLLIFSKLDLKRTSYSLENVNICDMIEEIIGEIEPELEANKAYISIVNNSTKQVVNVDKYKFKRVVLNILNNSQNYRRNDTCNIEIAFENVMDSIVICFKDDGIGIDEENLPYIFSAFYRSDKARTNTKNSGLGLSISKMIIEGLGGKIWAKSEFGKGTSIFISMELSKE